MNILIANNRYFRSGGPETYMFGVMAALEQKGHFAIPFAVNYAQNVPSPYSRFFPPTPSQDRSAIYHHELHLGPREKVRLLGQSIYSFEARRNLKRLLRENHVDVAYLLGIANVLSPSIIDECVAAGVPVVMFFMDYNVVCASYHFMRSGAVCRDCYSTKLNAIRHRCVKDSVVLSMARVLGMKIHDMLRLYQKVDAFIAPSKTMMSEMIRAGLPARGMHHIPYFVDLEAFLPNFRQEGPVVYVGRLAPEKGVDTLLRAYAGLGTSMRPGLRIVGSETAAGQERHLRQLAAQLGLSDVIFAGAQSPGGVARELASARLVVVPSRWLENTPLVVYEAMASGKPVLASRIGSLSEQVIDGETGFTFEANDPASLTLLMTRVLANPELGVQMGQKARARVESNNSPNCHVSRLAELFTALAARR